MVSVIVPTFNRGDLIGETLQSVLAQTYPSFEVVVIDDGSTDDTKRVVTAFRDARVRYYWQGNSGLPACARNVGIRVARGRYIAFLDSDDLWLHEKLAIQIGYMEAQQECGFSFTNGEFFGAGGRCRRINKIGLVRRRSIRQLLCGNFVPTLTAVVRRGCLMTVGGFNEDPRMKAIEDYELWLRLASVYGFAYLPVVTARCRRDPRSLAGTNPVRAARLAASMLETLSGRLPVSEHDFARGLATHYRRLARAHALAGNPQDYCEALLAAWRTYPDGKTAALLGLYRLTGFRVDRLLIEIGQNAKYFLDDLIWHLRRPKQIAKG